MINATNDDKRDKWIHVDEKCDKYWQIVTNCDNFKDPLFLYMLMTSSWTDSLLLFLLSIRN